MRKAVVLMSVLLLAAMLLGGIAYADGNATNGAHLYDKWWGVTGADAPSTDMPLWASQSSNTRSGADTWRCKECHGWDYKGKDGAYASGSHATGFAGVYDAQSKSVEDLVSALKGGTNADHDFSAYLDYAALTDLATFIKTGFVDDSQYIDYATKAGTGDATNGKAKFDGLCAACHGADGQTINFKDEAHPEYVGTVASDNPQEFLHKARFGQPDGAMPATADMGWSVQDAADVLAYAQTLPTGEEAAAAAPAELPTTGSSQTTWLYIILAGFAMLLLGGVSTFALRDRS